LNRRGLKPGFFAGGLIEDGGAHFFSLRPTKIHAQEDRGPILRLRPAGAGLDGHDGVEIVVLAGEQGARFQLRDVVFGGG
jgi:hypothetical protein